MKKSLIRIIVPVLFLFDILLKQFVLVNADALVSGAYSFHLTILPFVHFDLTYLENTGMAWGMFSSFQSIILVVRIGVIGAIIYGLITKESMRKHMFAFQMILFGAIGNVLDTFIYGHVIDMLNFSFWGSSYGVFNIADAMIFLGAISMLLSNKRSYALKE